MSKITKSAKDQSCIRCDIDGTTRACHYNGPRQHSYGKGRGIKCDDLMTADFCHDCDQDFTEGTTHLWENEWERSEDFLHWIAMTNIRRIKQGVIKA